MVDVITVAGKVVEPIARHLLAERGRRQERERTLAELVNVTLTDDFGRRRFDREIEAVTDVVARRLHSTLLPHGDVPENDRLAALAAVRDSFVAADLSDDALFATDLDPSTLASRVRTALPRPRRAILGEHAERLYEQILRESCLSFARIVVHLPTFVPRGMVEVLERSTRLSAQVEELFDRLPTPTLDAPRGTDRDSEFLARYLGFVSEYFDEVELFGVDVHRYRPRTALSLAYISLSVSTTSSKTPQPRWVLPHDTALEPPVPSAVRVEQALGGSSRVLVRGEAGSGKTTLLNWLALTAARKEFTSTPSTWNGRVPFLVKLRSYAGGPLPGPDQFLRDYAGQLGSIMPAAWAHRQLVSGNGLLLIDGVDELPVADRERVRRWLRSLLLTYPDTAVVVTARPTAATTNWLAGESFRSVSLEPMGSSQVRELIAHWHVAIREAGDLPCDPADLGAYEHALVAALDRSPHLRGLATSPLMCAMLCALNLDRHKQLPPDRMGVYEAALSLLAGRRDAERGIPSAAGVRIDPQGSLTLLQALAWRLSLNGRTELSKDDAARQIGYGMASMPTTDESPEAVLDHLLRRSGVLLEPVPGRVAFVHRTFQEYLAACEAADQGNLGFLVDHAHLDSWRETIIMAAGRGARHARAELVSQLLDRAAEQPRRSRRLRLLAAACLDTIGSVAPEVREQVEGGLDELVPPRSIRESRSLASAGSSLLRRVPPNLSGLGDSAAAALIRAVALTGAPEALQILAEYAKDPAARGHRSLLVSSGYFDPAEYGRTVLAHMGPDHEWFLENRDQLIAYRNSGAGGHLRYLRLEDVTDLASDLTGLRNIEQLWVDGRISNIAPVLAHSDALTGLVVECTEPPDDLDELSGLHRLRYLSLHPGRPVDSIEFVRRLPGLVHLGLFGLDSVHRLDALARLTETSSMVLERVGNLVGLGFPTLPKLRELELVNPKQDLTLGVLAQRAPALGRLALVVRADRASEPDPIPDLGELNGPNSLHSLDLVLDGTADLTRITQLSNLSELVLDCPVVPDLAPLSRLPNLRLLRFGSAVREVDLSPLEHRDLTVVVSDRATYRTWRDRYGRRLRLAESYRPVDMIR